MSQWQTEYIPGPPRIAVDHMGHGPLVIFIHGIGGNRTNWHDQLPAFADHFHAVAWDARGYGASDDYTGALDFADISRDLIRVIDYFRTARVHLVGLSMGGVIAIDFQTRYPEHVATLTLCDTPRPGAMAAMAPEHRRAQMSEFIRLRQEPLLAGKEPRDIAPGIAKTLLGKSAAPAIFQRLVDSMGALHKESYLKAIEALVTYIGEVQPPFENFRVPTHVVVGNEDMLTPPETSREIARRIPSARLTVIESAGHLSNIEQPAAFNQAVLSFLLEHR